MMSVHEVQVNEIRHQIENAHNILDRCHSPTHIKIQNEVSAGKSNAIKKDIVFLPPQKHKSKATKFGRQSRTGDDGGSPHMKCRSERKQRLLDKMMEDQALRPCIHTHPIWTGSKGKLRPAVFQKYAKVEGGAFETGCPGPHIIDKFVGNNGIFRPEVRSVQHGVVPERTAAHKNSAVGYKGLLVVKQAAREHKPYEATPESRYTPSNSHFASSDRRWGTQCQLRNVGQQGSLNAMNIHGRETETESSKRGLVK
ncbi:hypothetical protein DFH07DRAFT_772640 [Mycena maculata]|uniref:Uncharacterized protein n=1 Tax=Mycena maculata TaxID=230809 RepID=A0AAD7NF68_9AGAR|nr:hypothetical protein DFH07DRAFT_772640 [Mycena maculata]